MKFMESPCSVLARVDPEDLGLLVKGEVVAGEELGLFLRLHGSRRKRADDEGYRAVQHNQVKVARGPRPDGLERRVPQVRGEDDEHERVKACVQAVPQVFHEPIHHQKHVQHHQDVPEHGIIEHIRSPKLLLKSRGILLL
jgi:hypothetical protein